MGKLKIHVLYEHAADLKPYGSSYIRLLLPLEHPANQTVLQVSRGLRYKRSDILIVDRLWRPDISVEIVRNLVKRARRDGSKIVYSIDDDILDLEPAPPLRVWPSLEHKLAVLYLLRKSDAVLVSTQLLQDRLKWLNDRVIVLPNAIDERLFMDSKAPRSQVVAGRRIKIGYMGTLSHDDDLLMIIQPLRALLRKWSGSGQSGSNTGVSFEVVGGVLDKSLMQLFDGLPVRLVEVPGSQVRYPKFVHWLKNNAHWDIAVAPLADEVFTRCKSDIKFLDYAGLGVPGIYSRVPAYSSTVVHLQTGLLADNSYRGWTEALEHFIGDEQLRRSVATAATSYVDRERTLRVCAHGWADALMAL